MKRLLFFLAIAGLLSAAVGMNRRKAVTRVRPVAVCGQPVKN